MDLVLYPNKILSEKTNLVEQINSEVLELVQGMYQTLEKEGGLGLAAPQVGHSKAIFIVKTEKESYTFINPEIISREGQQFNYEGCLSIPGIQERVLRSYQVTIKALNEQGQEFTLDTKTNALLAQVIQHEYDHLQGILMLDHLDQIQKDRNRVALKKLSKLQQAIQKLKKPILKKKPKIH